VDYPRIAVSGVILYDRQVLLVEFSGGQPSEHYNFPGGGLELGETLDQAVRREVREESGLEVEVGRLLLIVESVGSRNTNTFDGVALPWNEVRFYFACTPIEASHARQPDVLDNDHQTNVRWVDLDALPELPLLPQVGQSVIAAIALPDAPPFVVPAPPQ
jgi:8-oxo-dGTP diphosphatase